MLCLAMSHLLNWNTRRVKKDRLMPNIDICKKCHKAREAYIRWSFFEGGRVITTCPCWPKPDWNGPAPPDCRFALEQLYQPDELPMKIIKEDED